MRIIHKPVLCNYYLTYRCNAKCSFCDIWEKPSPYANEEHYLSNIRDLRRLGVKVIDFTGGEPLLHRHLPFFLEKAKEYGFITTVTSNGLLYPKVAEKLRGLIDMLHFSLDSVHPEVHNRSRGVDCFQYVMESIRIATGLGERPDVIFTVTPHNLTEIGEVYEQICLPHGLVLILNPVFDYGELNVDQGFTPEDLDQLELWSGKRNIYINGGFIQLRRDGGNHTADPVCRAASSTIVISPENELVLPCYHLGIERFPIENRLMEVYGRPDIKSLIKMEGRYKACEGCTINCYMQPSFAVEINRYWWKALSSTLKYNWIKGTWKELV